MPPSSDRGRANAWPMFEPQQNTAPLCMTAHELLFAHAKSIVRSGNITRSGTVRGATSPTPS